MKHLRLALAGLLALFVASAALAQTFPTVPAQSVIGRLGIPGVSGPSQAIPFATLVARLGGTPSANTVWAGPTSGGAAAPTFRALVGADLPNPAASSLGGVQSKTCAANQWLNTISVAGVPACAQPAIADISGFGTGVATALGVNVGSAGSPIINGGGLGTPSSGVATNLTGTAAGLTAGSVTTNANLTGPITSVGNATSIASQTGTGTKFVVDTSPLLVTPNIGVATGTSLAATGAITSSGTAGIGYATGAGSTVTQGTSRATNVTINKLSGAITLFAAVNAAVSGATAVTFSVLNNTVAATDTVIVNQKSGTDKYLIFVTTVSGTGFNITHYTTGGTTNESPVFNFTVIKGVSS